MRTMKTVVLSLLAALGLNAQAATLLPSVAHFDDIYLAPESYWNGVPSAWPGTDSTIVSGPASFHNNAVDWGGGFSSWSGWAVSNTTDTTTPGFGNQYSAYPGGGYHSDSYGVAFVSSTDPARVDFGAGTVLGGWFTNTTYAALSMLNGDAFAKKFGGTSGDDPDWFRLTIYGMNGSTTTGQVDFYLADYRFSDNSQDYVVDQWTWVDLTPLGVVDGLEFALDSSDIGAFGMNTPAYFALDGLVVAPVPLPGALWLLVSGLAGLIALRRRS